MNARIAEAETAYSDERRNWLAKLELGFCEREGRTVLSHRKRLGPLAVQRPFYPEGSVCHVYILHPPGGVVGGDQLNIDLQVESGAVLITTPGATKHYRSAGPFSRQIQTLSVKPGASLEWLPQENIAFPGSRAALKTHIKLEGDAQIAAWEIHCLGRPANAEVFDDGSLVLRLELWRDSVPLLLDCLRITPESMPHSSRLNANPVSATFLLSGMDKLALKAVRELVSDHRFAATLIENILLLRYLGDSTEQARKIFIACWILLRPRQLKRTANRPRIWAT